MALCSLQVKRSYICVPPSGRAVTLILSLVTHFQRVPANLTGWVVLTILLFWREITVRTFSRIYLDAFSMPIELSPFGRGAYETLACRGRSLHVSLFGHTIPPSSYQHT